MKLIFVYNADSGLLNTVLDSVHKLVSPQTYSCNLCKITFSTFSVREKWTQFIKNSTIETEFLHKNEFTGRFGSTKFIFPVILKFEDNKLETFISAEELNKMKSDDDLIEFIKKNIS